MFFRSSSESNSFQTKDMKDVGWHPACRRDVHCRRPHHLTPKVNGATRKSFMQGKAYAEEEGHTVQGGASPRGPGLGWLRFGMFHQYAWAVGSYSIGPPAWELSKSKSTQPRSARRCPTLHFSRSIWKVPRLPIHLKCTRLGTHDIRGALDHQVK